MSRYRLCRYLLRQESFLNISENVSISLIQMLHFPRVKTKATMSRYLLRLYILLHFIMAIITLNIDNCNHLARFNKNAEL